MRMRLLFDEDCAKVYVSGKAEIMQRYPEAVCVGHHPDLPQGLEDSKIMEYAIKNQYIIVTRDARFVRYCCDNNAKVAVLKGNRIYLIEKAEQILGSDMPTSLFSPD